jgi:hypothetical protein
VVAERLMGGLATVASALNANDRCLARIAAVHLKIPDIDEWQKSGRDPDVGDVWFATPNVYEEKRNK